MWCAHNEPLAVDVRHRASRSRARHAARTGGRHVPAVVEQGRPRPLRRARDPQGRPDARRRPALRRAAPASGATAPTPTSTSAGTTARSTASRRRCAPCRGSAASSPSSAPRPCPSTADFMEPERWPDLDWDALVRAPRVPEAATSTGTSRPRCSTRFEAWRDATQRYQAALIQLQVEDLRRLRYDADRRLLPVLLRRRPSRGHVVGARPRPRPEGRVRRAPRRVPDRAARCSSPGAGSSTWRTSAATRSPARSSRSTIDGRPARFAGRRPGRRRSRYIGRVAPRPPRPGDVDARASRHPDARRRVENRYDDVLDWLRIVNDRQAEPVGFAPTSVGSGSKRGGDRPE